MTEAPTLVYRLSANMVSWEAPVDMGTYPTRELAEQAKAEMVPLWPDLTDDDFYVSEEPLRSKRPEVHLYVAGIPLLAPHTPDVQRCRPSLTPSTPMTNRLDDPVRFLRNPLTEAFASGETPELALARAQVCLQELLARGADDVLRKSMAVCERAEAIMAEREKAAGSAGLSALARFEQLCQLQEELAQAEFS